MKDGSKKLNFLRSTLNSKLKRIIELESQLVLAINQKAEADELRKKRSEECDAIEARLKL